MKKMRKTNRMTSMKDKKNNIKKKKDKRERGDRKNEHVLVLQL